MQLKNNLMLRWTSDSFLSNSSSSASLILDLRITSRFFYEKWERKNGVHEQMKPSLNELKLSVTTNSIIPCEGQTAADVESNPLYWEIVSYKEGKPTFSSLSACPGFHQHHQDLPLLLQGHCLHCRLPQVHTKTQIHINNHK